MTLPKDTVKPEYNFTYPSERQYYDETGSTLGEQRVADPAKSGADYGIQNPPADEAVDGTSSETSNGGGTPRRSSAE